MFEAAHLGMSTHPPSSSHPSGQKRRETIAQVRTRIAHAAFSLSLSRIVLKTCVSGNGLTCHMCVGYVCVWPFPVCEPGSGCLFHQSLPGSTKHSVRTSSSVCLLMTTALVATHSQSVSRGCVTRADCSTKRKHKYSSPTHRIELNPAPRR